MGIFYTPRQNPRIAWVLVRVSAFRLFGLIKLDIALVHPTYTLIVAPKCCTINSSTSP